MTYVQHRSTFPLNGADQHGRPHYTGTKRGPLHAPCTKASPLPWSRSVQASTCESLKSRPKQPERTNRRLWQPQGNGHTYHSATLLVCGTRNTNNPQPQNLVKASEPDLSPPSFTYLGPPIGYSAKIIEHLTPLGVTTTSMYGTLMAPRPRLFTQCADHLCLTCRPVLVCFAPGHYAPQPGSSI